MSAATNPTVWSIAFAAIIVSMTRPRPAARRCDAVRADGEHVRERPTSAAAERSPLHRPRGARWRTRQRDEATELALWCDALARAVRGGDSLHVALRSTPAPERDRPIIDHLVRELERTGIWSGQRPADRRAGSDADRDLVLAVIGACHEHGGPAAEPLDRAAEVLRGRAAERAERQVHSAQARLSAQVMSILPAVMLVVLTATSSAVREVVARPVGIALIGCGVTLDLIGWVWMRRVIARSAR